MRNLSDKQENFSLFPPRKPKEEKVFREGEKQQSNVYVTIVINLLAQSINVNTPMRSINTNETTSAETTCLSRSGTRDGAERELYMFVWGEMLRKNAWDENRKKMRGKNLLVIKLNCSLSAYASWVVGLICK